MTLSLTASGRGCVTDVCEVAEYAAAEEHDGGGERFVAVEHLLPLFG